MTKLRLYHCSNDQFAVGDLLTSDYKSKTKLLVTNNAIVSDRDGQARLEVENIFENYLWDNSLVFTLPSRGDCVFTCQKYEHLARWQVKGFRPFSYELETVDVEHYFATDAVWFNFVLLDAEQGKQHPHTEEYVRRYWSGASSENLPPIVPDEPRPHYEVLIKGILKVSKILGGNESL